MLFPSMSFGFNEWTLTTVTYVCYLLAILFYSLYLMTRSARAVTRVRGQMALAGAGAGAGAGGTSDITMSDQTGERSGTRLSPTFGRIASSLMLLAWASLTTALILRWISIGHAPYVTLYEISTMLVWGTTTIYLILFEGVIKTRAAGAFVALLIFILQSYALLAIPAELKTPIQLVPALRSNWLMVHVSMAILSYSAFAVAAGAGLALLAKHYMKGRMSQAMPSEAAIEEFMFRAVAVGFPFMTLVLITGAFWANEAWTKAWSWDPKEIWALITWLTYAAFLHVRVQRGVRGTTMAWLSLIGFAVVLITFMGVNYLVQIFGLTSMHTYSVDNGTPPVVSWLGIGTVVVLAILFVLAVLSWLRVKMPWQRSAKATRK